MAPVRISIVYQSGGGHTRVLAQALAGGCTQVADTTAELVEILGQDVHEGRWSNNAILEKLAAADAIVFGCPTYMGSVSAIFKAFLETCFTPWAAQTWKDKFAAGFTNSASQNGDKLSTLIQLSIFAAQMGMIWVGVGDGPGNNWSGGTVADNNRLGSWLGAMGQSNGAPGTGARPIGRRPFDRCAPGHTPRPHHRQVPRPGGLRGRAPEALLEPQAPSSARRATRRLCSNNRDGYST